MASIYTSFPLDPYQQSIKRCYDCISTITNDLYITNAEGAYNYPMLSQLGITTIISVTLPEYFKRPNYPDIDFIRLDAPDSPNFKLDRYFDEVSADIHQAIKSGGRVLVHCQVGMSRSPTIVIAYLMKYEGMTLNMAHRRVITQRPIIQPNCGFWRQLIKYEKKLFGYNTVFMGDIKDC